MRYLIFLGPDTRGQSETIAVGRWHMGQDRHHGKEQEGGQSLSQSAPISSGWLVS